MRNGVKRQLVIAPRVLLGRQQVAATSAAGTLGLFHVVNRDRDAVKFKQCVAFCWRLFYHREA